ncbi:hypothetical protein [Streptomyces yerevanensis]|uniref:hypothetical protein n=1 Tax=Streptomyces yerevanensis TaxID=66378 RepID=UPI00068EA195|nr:hypothetical protein [Streptomyces yerevanensis]
MQRTGLRTWLVGGPARFPGERGRVQGALGALFDRVFMILEDYSVDPELAEPGDLDDVGLQTAVHAAWDAYRHSGTDQSQQ